LEQCSQNRAPQGLEAVKRGSPNEMKVLLVALATPVEESRAPRDLGQLLREPSITFRNGRIYDLTRVAVPFNVRAGQRNKLTKAVNAKTRTRIHRRGRHFDRLKEWLKQRLDGNTKPTR